jgi:hypothetical protein
MAAIDCPSYQNFPSYYGWQDIKAVRRQSPSISGMIKVYNY